MALTKGLALYSRLSANEPLADAYYAKVVSNKEIESTVSICKEIHETLSMFVSKPSNEILQALAVLCGKKGANYSEFIAYWPVHNMTQSIYKGNFLSPAERRKWIDDVAPKFIAERWNTGVPPFSRWSVLAQMDAKAHKRTGPQGPGKIRQMLAAIGFVECKTAAAFEENDYAFLMPDGASDAYLEVLSTYADHFEWGTRYSNKIPDAVVRANDQFFIIEHKHKKEEGGGQNGALIEVLDLIEKNDASPNVHYIGFLDGIWWNRIFQEERAAGGSKTQHNSSRIHEALSGKGANNYFVNTEGLQLLFSEARAT